MMRNDFFPQHFKILDTHLQSEKCLLVLDYDGTLKTLQPHPDMAAPDEQLNFLIKELTGNTKNELCIISGRDRDTLEHWFGNTEVTLVAEHGFYYKKERWKNLVTESADWKQDIKSIMERFSKIFPNTFVEEKSASISWHYRQATYEISQPELKVLINILIDILAGSNATILEGNKVIEVKTLQANKGTALKSLFDFKQYDCCICIGDDKTDEDMFEVVNEAGGHTFKVGSGNTLAKHRFKTVNEVLFFLTKLGV